MLQVNQDLSDKEPFSSIALFIYKLNQSGQWVSKYAKKTTIIVTVEVSDKAERSSKTCIALKDNNIQCTCSQKYGLFCGHHRNKHESTIFTNKKLTTLFSKTYNISLKPPVKQCPFRFNTNPDIVDINCCEQLYIDGTDQCYIHPTTHNIYYYNGTKTMLLGHVSHSELSITQKLRSYT